MWRPQISLTYFTFNIGPVANMSDGSRIPAANSFSEKLFAAGIRLPMEMFSQGPMLKVR